MSFYRDIRKVYLYLSDGKEMGSQPQAALTSCGYDALKTRKPVGQLMELKWLETT